MTSMTTDGTLTREPGLARGGMALVRPDGDVGLLGTDTGAGALRGYLADVLHVRVDDGAPQVAR